jgi:hypothetical protein
VAAEDAGRESGLTDIAGELPGAGGGGKSTALNARGLVELKGTIAGRRGCSSWYRLSGLVVPAAEVPFFPDVESMD